MDQIETMKYPIGKFQKPAHYDSANLAEWIDTIKAMPGWIDACIENLDEFQLNTPYRDGGWTVQQLVHHLADSHMNAYIRLKLALTEDEPVIKPYLEKSWAELPDSLYVPVNVSTTLLHALHRRWGYTLEKMMISDWERTYFHPEHQKNVALWEMTALYAWHCKHHTQHIMQLRKKMNW